MKQSSGGEGSDFVNRLTRCKRSELVSYFQSVSITKVIVTLLRLFLLSSVSLALALFLPPLSQGPEGTDVVETSLSLLNVPRSLSLHYT